MAARTLGFTEAKFKKWIKEGRGNGRNADYHPWLTVYDVPSLGRVHRVFGYKSQRTHHLLSDLELSVFLMLEWHREVEEVREQFPLQRDFTLSIAKEAGVSHPKVNGVNQYMSSDFLVNTTNPEEYKFVLQAKRSEELADARTTEKLEVERRYWEMKEVPFYLITERDIPKVITQNIDWLYPMQHQEEDLELSSQRLEFYAHHLGENPDKTVTAICKDLDIAYSLATGESLYEMRYLLAKRYFKFDIFIPTTRLKGADIIPGDMAMIQELYRVSNQ